MQNVECRIGYWVLGIGYWVLGKMNYLKKLILYVVCLMSVQMLNGQETCASKHEIIEGIEKYRRQLIGSNKNDFKYLHLLVNRIQDLNIPQDQISAFIIWLQYLDNLKSEYRQASILRFYEKFNLDTENVEFSKQELMIIARNKDLLELINIGLFKETYPFQIDTSSFIIDEIEFMEIQDGERIGEIGGGSGQITFILSFIYPNSEFIINDLNAEYVSDMKSRISTINLDTSRIKITRGGYYTTSMEKENLDKIVMRNVFHHIEPQKRMLRSVRKSIKPSGALIMLEHTRHNDFPNCSSAMKDNKIAKIVEKESFQLKDKIQEENKVVYRFVNGE